MQASAPPRLSPLPRTREVDLHPDQAFSDLYRRHFGDCRVWLRAMGAPSSELDDLAQDVFVVVRRRLAEQPPGTVIANPRGWIYGIAFRTLSDQRRRPWWRLLLGRHRGLPEDHGGAGPGPLDRLEAAEKARLCQALLARLPVKQASALVLFEVEGYSGQEIAALEGVPLQTVFTRIHHARKAFLALAEREQKRRKREEEGRP